MKVFYKQNSYVHLNFVSQIRDANEINRMTKELTRGLSRRSPDYTVMAEVEAECVKRELEFDSLLPAGWNRSHMITLLLQKGYVPDREQFSDYSDYHLETYGALKAPKFSKEELCNIRDKLLAYSDLREMRSNSYSDQWRYERDTRDTISKGWLDTYDYSREVVAKNIIAFYDYKDPFKEVAVWKFDTEEEMNQVYKILADKLKQTVEEIII